MEPSGHEGNLVEQSEPLTCGHSLKRRGVFDQVGATTVQLLQQGCLLAGEPCPRCVAVCPCQQVVANGHAALPGSHLDLFFLLGRYLGPDEYRSLRVGSSVLFYCFVFHESHLLQWLKRCEPASSVPATNGSRQERQCTTATE